MCGMADDAIRIQVQGIPATLWRNFAVEAQRRGVNQRDAVRDALIDAIHRWLGEGK